MLRLPSPPLQYFLEVIFNKCFIPRREIRSISLGVHLFLLMFYWCRKRYPGFKILLGLSHFFFAKMFYPPKGVCFADSHRGPIVFTLHFIGVGRGTQDSKSYWFYRIFFFAKMFYCDGWTGGRVDGWTG